MSNLFKNLFPADPGQLQDQLAKLRDRMSVPVFWMFGRTQSGKTSIIKFLTGAAEAEVGQGFKPCTRYSREYQFPTVEAPLIRFLDTRGLDDPSYDPAEDLEKFNAQAHLVVVTVKAMDHAQENVLKNLRVLRDAQPSRPVVLALTCLHEAYPQQQHQQPYPFIGDGTMANQDLLRSLEEQHRRFDGLVDAVVPIDLTKPEEGFTDPVYGGERLKEVLLNYLPHAYRQTLLTLDEATADLKDWYARRALPHIAGYSSLAAAAGAMPIPWLDLFILPGIQTRMIYHLAQLYGQPLSAARFMELAGTLGMGLVIRQALRETMKLIPYVGSVAGAALASASTFALGKAFCFYYSSILQGHVPQPDKLKRYYEEQLAQAEKFFKRRTHDQGAPPS